MRSTPSEVCGHVCVGVIELITTRARETKPCRSAAVLAATLHEERRAEGGVHERHGLELSWRQELFGGHDRRETRARGRPPNRSGQRQRVPDGATLHAREEHARLTYAGGGSSVTGRLGVCVCGGGQLVLTLPALKEEDEALWEPSPRPSGSLSYG